MSKSDGFLNQRKQPAWDVHLRADWLAWLVIELAAEYKIRLRDVEKTPSEANARRLAVCVDELRARLQEFDYVTGQTVEAYMRIATPADPSSQNFRRE